MSDVLLVNFAALQEASGHIQSAIGELESRLAQVEQDAAPLVHTWTGEAQQAYQARQASWRQAAGELSAVLGEIRRALDESCADYRRTELRNANLFR